MRVYYFVIYPNVLQVNSVGKMYYVEASSMAEAVRKLDMRNIPLTKNTFINALEETISIYAPTAKKTTKVGYVIKGVDTLLYPIETANDVQIMASMSGVTEVGEWSDKAILIK